MNSESKVFDMSTEEQKEQVRELIRQVLADAYEVTALYDEPTRRMMRIVASEEHRRVVLKEVGSPTKVPVLPGPEQEPDYNRMYYDYRNAIRKEIRDWMLDYIRLNAENARNNSSTLPY